MLSSYFFDNLALQVLHPEEIVDPKIDPLSVITYISQFSEAKLKEGLPLLEQTGDPYRVKVYGNGLNAKILITNEKDAEFSVDVSEAGFGPLRVAIVSSENVKVNHRVEFKRNEKLFTCSYVPVVNEQYVIEILWCGRPIPNSPFKVETIDSKQPTNEIAEGIQVYGPSMENLRHSSLNPADLPLVLTGPFEVDVNDHSRYSIEHSGVCQYSMHTALCSIEYLE